MDLLPCVEMSCRYGGDAVCRTLNRAGFKIGARQIFFMCHIAGLEGEPDVVRNTRTDGRSKEFQQEFRNKMKLQCQRLKRTIQFGEVYETYHDNVEE